VDVRDLHEWPSDAEEARQVQDQLRALLELDVSGPQRIGTIAGLDVSYEEGTDRLAATVVVLDAKTLQVVEESSQVGTAAFPYVPGLFAFRELPTLVEALRGLTVTPDLLVCDGHGIAHPRRFGLACHIGVLTGVPSIGVGKTRLIGSYEEPLPERGSYTPLREDGEVLGRVLRTQDGIKPVFVSVGHRIDLDTACAHVLAATPEYRLPETTRRADRLSRDLLNQTEEASQSQDVRRP
jgi:deoxyribonuclease V